ncbi:transcriptional regulator, IclR family [Caldalkalibacillus thermarum TA2.A1]|uniref:Glycerol operon regulatory protein n=1 Tax=Caldalkalibacillus thermarum (strain TA2.A1) TaxID=986075 RepID=F5L6F2_CALTT|nr:IclR family transcriptional regulator [Caldalkalibacillus thermarum]EGL83062.1 transcriptional regulator, IclR family [Caldalkalibacillus thermarum TA2.A1]QZT34899.1 IclR family transcriptional regulator [Caldalkalibacillus thermarum TA2.A1]
MEKKTVRSVERALDILLCFTTQHELSLTEISHQVGLNKSTVYRLLASLEKKGFVAKNEATEKYRLGFRVWELSAHLERVDDPAVMLLPEMERLRDILDETVTLYVRDGKERVRVQAVESKQTIRRVAPIGVRMPLNVGASGKILVAYAEPEVQEMILNDPDWPEHIDKEAFMLQLLKIRQLGYATSVEEREAGTSAIAAPIFNRQGKCVAALAVSGPTGRLTLEKMEEIAPTVMDFASRMSKMVG